MICLPWYSRTIETNKELKEFTAAIIAVTENDPTFFDLIDGVTRDVEVHGNTTTFEMTRYTGEGYIVYKVTIEARSL